MCLSSTQPESLPAPRKFFPRLLAGRQLKKLLGCSKGLSSFPLDPFVKPYPEICPGELGAWFNSHDPILVRTRSFRLVHRIVDRINKALIGLELR
jgi:hypothetical protein